MDYLLTGIVISLICLAAWLIYKRWVGRYRSAPEPEEYEEIPEPSVETMVAEPVAEPAPAEEN